MQQMSDKVIFLMRVKIMKMVQLNFVENLHNTLLKLALFSSSLGMIGSVLMLFAQRNCRRVSITCSCCCATAWLLFYH